MGNLNLTEAVNETAEEQFAKFRTGFCCDLGEVHALFEAIGKFDDCSIFSLSNIGKMLIERLQDQIENFKIA